LRGEVKAYSQHISGDVWRYIVKGTSGEFEDSCGGYYGHDFEKNGLLADVRGHIDWHIAKAYKDRAEQVKTWIRNRVPLRHRYAMEV